MSEMRTNWLEQVEDITLMMRLNQTNMPPLLPRQETDSVQLGGAIQKVSTAVSNACNDAFCVIVFSNKERDIGQISDLDQKYPGMAELARLIGAEYIGHIVNDSARVFVVDAPDLGGYRFRVTAEQTLDERVLSIRKEEPNLWSLKNLLKEKTDFFIEEVMYADLIKNQKNPTPVNGGVIFVIGDPGSGKTTLAVSFVNEWMHRHRITAITLERNQDYRIPRVLENGSICHQLDINNRSPREVFERSVLTMSHDLLFFGEILHAEDAHIVIDAANSGKTVVATLHGKTIAAGLDRLIRKIKGQETEEIAKEILSEVLRWAILVKTQHGQGGRSTTYQPLAFTQAVKSAWKAGSFDNPVSKAEALWRRGETQNTR